MFRRLVKLSGHKTDHIFRAYNIQDEDDLIDAAKKLEQFGGAGPEPIEKAQEADDEDGDECLL